MNLPFFRFRKSETAAAVQSHTSASAKPTSAKIAAGASDGGNASQSNRDNGGFEIPLGSLLPLLPDSAIKRGSGLDLNHLVSLPLNQILPQLAKGRVLLPLGEVLARLPSDVVASPLPYGDSEKVMLPLEQVVSRLSPDCLNPRTDQREIHMNDDIPSPFTEEPASASDWTETATALSEEATTPRATGPLQEDEAAKSDQESDSSAIGFGALNDDTPIFAGRKPQPVAPDEHVTSAADPSASASKQAKQAEETPSAPIAEVKPEVEPVQAEQICAPSGTPAAGQQAVKPVAQELQAEQPVQAEPRICGEDEVADLDSIAAQEVTQPRCVAEPAPTVRALSQEEIAKTLADLNSWPEEEFHKHSLGPTLTQRILEYRARKGGFKDLRELLEIAGVGPRLFERVLGFRPEALDDQEHAINRLLGVTEDHEMSLQEIVKCTSQLPGVEGCIVAMGDGLYMTGELPSHYDMQRVSAFAPQLFSRVAQYVQELNVGTARRFTVFTDAQPITIFKSGELFFIVIHKANRFSKALLNKCERISQEISRLCSQETAKS